MVPGALRTLSANRHSFQSNDFLRGVSFSVDNDSVTPLLPELLNNRAFDIIRQASLILIMSPSMISSPLNIWPLCCTSSASGRLALFFLLSTLRLVNLQADNF